MDLNLFFNTLDQMFQDAKSSDEIEGYLIDSLKKSDDEKDYASYVSIGNEMIGFYRSICEYEKLFNISEDTLMLMEELNLGGTEHFATTLLNVATGYRAAGKLEESMSYYKQALLIYEQILPKDDYRFAGLYNNVSLLFQQLNELEKAEAFSNQALSIIRNIEGAKQEIPSNLTNLAMIKTQLGKIEEAEALLAEAITLFDQNKKEYTDSHYSAALAGLAEIYVIKKDYQKAIDYYMKAAEEVKLHYGETESYYLLLQNADIARKRLNS